jgi:F-type H+-transporting ATPase subunit b
MLIDWFTVAAQAINFFLLIYLLKRFLYKPVLKAIDAREQLIESQLANAAAQQKKAKEEQAIFQQKNENFEQESAKRMQIAIDAADNEKQGLLEQAQKDAVAKRRKYQESLLKDSRNLKQTLNLKISREVFAIARKVLKDLADESFEQQAVNVFIKKIRAMSAADKALLAKALAATSVNEPATLRSAFDLSEPLRKKMEQLIKQMFSKDIVLQYEIKEPLLSGIELIINGQKLVWSIDDYLLTLEQNITSFLKQGGQSEQAHQPNKT